MIERSIHRVSTSSAGFVFQSGFLERTRADDSRPATLLRREALGREGTFRSWRRTATEPFEGALLLIATPGPLGFLVAFCEQDGQEVTPLLLLKNAVPLYEVPAAIETDRVSREAWVGIRGAVLLYNPGPGGCL